MVFPTVPFQSLLSGTSDGNASNQKNIHWDAQMRSVLIELEKRDPKLCEEYVAALAAVPKLVAAESPAWMFVQRESGNFEKAAIRLCRWWKLRKRLFGQDRWLLPLNQTGRGALTPEDAQLLRTGFLLVMVTPAGQDPGGSYPA